MRIRFWGTRGSLPTALNAGSVRAKVSSVIDEMGGQIPADKDTFIDGLPFHLRGTYGGESSCVEIETDHDEYVVCDMGSGARRLALAALGKHGPAAPQTYNFFMSHLHWDHIMGMPFFVPAYIPGNKIRVHGCHEQLEFAFRRQQENPSFPVPFDVFGADVEFCLLEPEVTTEVAGLAVTPFKQLHAGDSYGYRFENEGKTAVYSTDSEHKLEDASETEYFVNFFQQADIVIFDAMYSLADSQSVKEDWGHSSNMVGVELCHIADAKRLAMFHHEPIFDDQKLDEILAETRRYEEIMRGEHNPLEVISAHDGMEIDL